MVKRLFVMALIVTLMVSSIQGVAKAEELTANPETVQEGTDPDFALLEEALLLVEKIPEELLTEEATLERLEWMITNAGNVELKAALQNELQNIVMPEPMFRSASAWECAKGIGYAIAQNAVPITKLLKVKQAIKAAGGATKFANKLVENYDNYRSIRKPGSRVSKYTKTEAMKLAIKKTANTTPDVFDALFAFLGVDTVKKNCFD
ncbi:hypothetical protein [Bacillus sp. LL01]|uniref:hypothetical protein n=1 Tax=Bacillus sp. LL01 TaxID=1665556 RepID=UPI00069EFD0A|nr:hypothetical protein [Bacillus sp. LL01]